MAGDEGFAGDELVGGVSGRLEWGFGDWVGVGKGIGRGGMGGMGYHWFGGCEGEDGAEEGEGDGVEMHFCFFVKGMYR